MQAEFSKITMESIWYKVKEETTFPMNNLVIDRKGIDNVVRSLVERVTSYEKAKEKGCILEQRTVLYNALFDLSSVPDIKYYAGNFISSLDSKFAGKICPSPYLNCLWHMAAITRKKW